MTLSQFKDQYHHQIFAAWIDAGKIGTFNSFAKATFNKIADAQS